MACLWDRKRSQEGIGGSTTLGVSKRLSGKLAPNVDIPPPYTIPKLNLAYIRFGTVL